MEKIFRCGILLKPPPGQNNQRYWCSPLGSISCSCCGNLQEVVTDTEAARTSHGESLRTHTKHMFLPGKGNTFVSEGFHDSVKSPSDVSLPSSSLREVHTMSRQIFLSISTSASKNESTSSSVMSPVHKTPHLLSTAANFARHTIILNVSKGQRSLLAYFACPLCPQGDLGLS